MVLQVVAKRHSLSSLNKSQIPCSNRSRAGKVEGALKLSDILFYSVLFIFISDCCGKNLWKECDFAKERKPEEFPQQSGCFTRSGNTIIE